MNTIYLFTDGSIAGNIGSPGFAIVTIRNDNTSTLLYHEEFIVEKCTNNIAEVAAIYLGLNHILNNIRPGGEYKIVVVSDSGITIKGLREWVFSWFNNIKDNKLYGSSGSLVANQGIFNAIIKLIIANKVPVEFIHIKGHVNPNNDSSIKHAMEVFPSMNPKYTSIPLEIITTLVQYNNFVDITTKKVLVNYADGNILASKIIPPNENIYGILENIELYRALISR